MRLCTSALAALAALACLAGCESKERAKASPEPASRQESPKVERAPEPAPWIAGPQVELVSKDYSRLKSRVLIRRLRRPTKANLEFAVYDSNVITFDPKEYTPTPPEEKVKLAALDFDGALVKDSLVDRIDGTPLTPPEKNSPMSWPGVSEHLINWDFEKALGFAEVGAKISDEKWNDDDVPIAYQQITRVYLHGKDGGTEVWVRVEFNPWVRFLEDIDDEDADGFPEFYGRFPPRLVTGEIVAEIEKYRGEEFSREDIKVLATEIGTHLYPKYNTETLDEEEVALWPTEEVRAEFGAELAVLGDERPTIVIGARPFGKQLYNVFIVQGFQKK